MLIVTVMRDSANKGSAKGLQEVNEYLMKKVHPPPEKGSGKSGRRRRLISKASIDAWIEGLPESA